MSPGVPKADQAAVEGCPGLFGSACQLRAMNACHAVQSTSAWLPPTLPGNLEVGVGAKVVQGFAGAAPPVPAAAVWRPLAGAVGSAGLHPAAASDVPSARQRR